MKELIARLQKTTGPDRALDVDIWTATTNQSQTPGVAPKFTESIDAAMTLVPKDFRTELEGLNQSWVAVCHSTALEIDVRGEAFTSTPAIALCIAALKSRSAQGD